MVRGTVLSLCVACLLSSAALAAGTGEAEESPNVVDLATITCKQFMENDESTIGSIVFWLNGYYKEEDDPATIDFADMKERAGKLGAYCATNPEHGLITAADEILSN